MTIAEPRSGDKGMGARIQGIFKRIPKDALALVAVVLASGAGFGVGMLVGREGAGTKDQLWIENLPVEERPAQTIPVKAAPKAQPAAAAAALPAGKSSGTYVASKSGSYYYLPSCSGSKRIKNENKVWFDTKAEAETKGLKPAKNCPGL